LNVSICFSFGSANLDVLNLFCISNTNKRLKLLTRNFIEIFLEFYKKSVTVIISRYFTEQNLVYKVFIEKFLIYLLSTYYKYFVYSIFF